MTTSFSATEIVLCADIASSLCVCLPRLQHVMDEHDTKVISAWHDIPLYVLDEHTSKPTGLLNFVCEIPRCSRKKFEISTTEPGNPIKQDEKKGVLREVRPKDVFRFCHRGC